MWPGECSTQGGCWSVCLTLAPKHRGNQHRPEVGSNRQRQIVSNLPVQSDAGVKGRYQLVVEHLLRIVEKLRVRVRLKRRVAGVRIGDHQRRSGSRFPAKRVQEAGVNLPLPSVIQDFGEAVEQPVQPGV